MSAVQRWSPAARGNARRAAGGVAVTAQIAVFRDGVVVPHGFGSLTARVAFEEH